MDNNMNNTQQPVYQQPVNPYQQTNQYQPQQAYQPQLEEPVSIGDWIGSMLLVSLVPCVGIIMCFVWAFSGNTKKSKSNFFKAYLIITLVSVVLSVIAVVALWGTLAAAMASSGYYYY